MLDPFIWRYSGPVSLVFVLVVIFGYLRVQGIPLTSIGLVRFTKARNWLWLLPQTLLAFVAIMLSGVGVSLLVMNFGADFMQLDRTQVDERFGDIQGNLALFLSWLAVLWVAGPAEEFYFRGYLMSRLSAGLGRSVGATFIVLLLPAFIFGIGHVYYQGIRGLFTTGAIGLSLGVLFLLFKRNIWPLAVAHAAFNSLVFTAQFAGWDI